MKKLALSLAVLATVSCTGPSPNPVSPASAMAGLFAGPNGETMKATAPSLLSPLNIEVEDLDPNFMWTDATARFAGSQTFTYEFQIRDTSGAVLQTLMVPQGATPAPNIAPVAGRTGVEISVQLLNGQSYTWRVRARLGTLVGPWSSAGSFKTVDRFTCIGLGNNPLAIIGCHRDRFDDHMNASESNEFIGGVAWDFNRVGVPGGPFGMLRKLTGNNCNGYSCDILCAGQGSSQVQYDILVDERFPSWGGGNDIHDGIRVDVCEIQ